MASNQSGGYGGGDRDRGDRIRNDRGGGYGGGGGNRNDRGGGRRGGGKPDRSSLPLEQGVVCTLRDNFGFIHCADRAEEIFFHYSEVNGMHPDDLQIDMELEFRVGASSSGRSGGGGGGETEKLAAFQVRALEPGTIVWEIPEAPPGQVSRGLVERAVRLDRGGSGNMEGVIRIVVEQKQKQQEANNDADAAVATADGPLVKFTPNDQPALDGPSGSRRSNRLSRGDFVEFTVVTDRRSKSKFARSIRLLLSERERVRQQQERKMLQDATLEHGVVTSLKGEYGFLRSNKRREDVYFHYSSIDLEEHNADEDGEFVLKEGQDMKFLVVAGSSDQQGPRHKISARQVKVQPRGSVKFHNVLARGVTGIVSICPQPVDSGHALDQQGRIQLLNPLKETDEEGNERVIGEVYMRSKHSPGGTFAFRGGSSVGLWIQEGDTLLFDVVKDFVDGTCHAAPTKYRIPPAGPPEVEQDGAEEESNNDASRAVHLIKLALASRAEGIVNTVKDSYGFVHYSERPVDVHFKLFQIFPDELQDSLRQNMGMANLDEKGAPLRLMPGAEIQFDLSIHGTIQSSNGSGGRHRGQRQQTAPSHERENLKAQRVLLLPPRTITQDKLIATDVQGTISKEDQRQPYAGAVDLDEAVKAMSPEERHPLVANMVETYLESDQETPLVYPDLQSLKEDDVVVAMLESKGKGKVSWTHLPQPGQSLYPGRLCIRKLEEEPALVVSDGEVGNAEAKKDGTDSDNGKSEVGDGTPNVSSPERKKKAPKAKPVKTVRFDKSSLVKDLKEDIPPTLGDVVCFDVVQSRRTGLFSVVNMRIVERHVVEVSLTDVSGMGIVKEILPARNFGFISVLDDTSDKREMLYFNLSSAASDNTDPPDDSVLSKKKTTIRKGDEVKFDVGTEKNGKRVAMNVAVIPKGTIPSQADKNACRGFILLGPSYTTLKNTPLRHAHSATSLRSDKSSASSRWDNVTDAPKRGGAEIIKEEGCILLLEDSTNMFGKACAPSNDSNPTEAERTSRCHLPYANGAIAIHGVGSSSAVDVSTNPRRGDLVSFMKARNGQGVRDVRIIERATATLQRGRLEQITREESNGEGSGSAKFIAATDTQEAYEVALSEVVSCNPGVLKEKDLVEGILHEGGIYGLCRTADLYLESKLVGAGKKERPKLNLIVKKDRGGTIMAQSMMAKGPDGTTGFAAGWTKRTSQYATASEKEQENDPDWKPDVEATERKPDAAKTGGVEKLESSVP